MDRTDGQPKPTTSTTSGRLGPVVGIDAGLTFWDRLAVDAALHWSSVGYAYSEVGYMDATTEIQLSEGMHFQKVSLPFTVGYAAHLGSLPLRIGIGYSLMYFTSGRYDQEIVQSMQPNGSYSFAKEVDVFSENDYFVLGPPRTEEGIGRWHGRYRIAMSLQPEPRLRIGMAATGGRDMSVFSTDPPMDGPENRIRFRSRTYDVTATFLLFR